MDSARGAVEYNGTRMTWAVDDSGRMLEIDAGAKMVVLTRAQAMAMLETLNAAIPHMSVLLKP